MDGQIFDKIIVGALAAAILFYLLGYVIIPSFNLTYAATVTGLSTTVLQGILFILFLIVIFSFVIMFYKAAGIGSG